MKIKLLVALLFCTFIKAYAQGNADTLQFNKRASRSINHWVVIQQGPGVYSYGFIYVDASAGFTYNLAGAFRIDASGNYLVDTALQSRLKTALMKYRLAPNTKPAAWIPQSRYAVLGITGDPSWLKIYDHYSDTLARNVAIGRNLNVMLDCEYALTYLLRVYPIQPHYPGLEFELGYAYNVLRRFDDAIAVLQSAIKNKPNDAFCYKELGYAYLEKKDVETAIKVFKDGITACNDGHTHMNEVAEMALNISAGYRYLKNDDLCKEWGAKAKALAPVNSETYKRAVELGY